MQDANTPPPFPIGLAAYRQWARWPYLRFGVRAYMRSTYDRTGGNHTADASHYLYQEAEDFNVTLDVEGPGILYFVRANRWHGSPWHYEVDGIDHIVSETTTADPLTPLADSVFIPEHAFPAPLTYTYATTKGADLNWVPIAFERRLRLAHARTYYGTGYYIYHQLADSADLEPWNDDAAPDQDVLALLSKAGDDIIEPGTRLREQQGRLQVTEPGVVPVVTLADGPAVVRRIQLSAPVDQARAFGKLRLRVTWDRRAHASIDAPLDLLHGAGTLHNPDLREWLVKAFPVSIRFHAGRVQLTCYFPMPYFEQAHIELVCETAAEPLRDILWHLATAPYDGPRTHVGYFHATYRDHGQPQVGRDLTFLDTCGVEGADFWSGHLVGTSFVFSERNVLTTLEGDPRFFFDDSLTPQAQGTGTEEWGGGGDYWGGRTMTLPLAGHPTGVVDDSTVSHPDDRIHSAYRFLVADLMPFGRRARICFEHGGENESLERYRSVTHWYGTPSATLTLCDTLEVGDPDSERAHAYHSPDASAPYTIRSRYEWGPDHLPVSLANPLADPDDHADFEFDAGAGRYYVWVEVRSGTELFEASIWTQFNQDVGADRLVPEYMGPMGVLNLGRPPGSYLFVTGRAPVSVVELHSTGRQRLRLQPRHGCTRLGRMLLSPHRNRRPECSFVPHADEILLLPAQASVHGGFEIVADEQLPGGLALQVARPPQTMEIYPSHELTGRRTLGTSEFSLQIPTDNHGVLLRRTLDYGYANQRAEVAVSGSDGWEPVGAWYLAGSTSVYHSFPWVEGELAPVQPRVIRSNRRFRDDELLLPSAVTRCRETLRLRVAFAPRNPPLLAGTDPLPSAWTEFAYRAYAYVMPRDPLLP